MLYLNIRFRSSLTSWELLQLYERVMSSMSVIKPLGYRLSACLYSTASRHCQNTLRATSRRVTAGQIPSSIAAPVIKDLIKSQLSDSDKSLVGYELRKTMWRNYTTFLIKRWSYHRSKHCHEKWQIEKYLHVSLLN